jgi:mannosyltransferase OCH1-like enzyme
MSISKQFPKSNKTVFLGLVAIKLAFVIYAIFQFHGKSRATHSTYFDTQNTNDILSFENFDNQTGSNVSIVPNIVHLIYFEKSKLRFFEMINIFSIYFNHNPELIYIHCDDCSFSGIYWEKIVAFKKLWTIIRINQVPRTETIFGVKYGNVQHRSDIFRLLVLMNYGGIYLDNDVYVVNPLNKYLKYEMAVSWDSDDDGIGNQVIIAHKNARFLKTHFDSYRYVILKKNAFTF